MSPLWPWIAFLQENGGDSAALEQGQSLASWHRNCFIGASPWGSLYPSAWRFRGRATVGCERRGHSGSALAHIYWLLPLLGWEWNSRTGLLQHLHCHSRTMGEHVFPRPFNCITPCNKPGDLGLMQKGGIWPSLKYNCSKRFITSDHNSTPLLVTCISCNGVWLQRRRTLSAVQFLLCTLITIKSWVQLWCYQEHNDIWIWSQTLLQVDPLKNNFIHAFLAPCTVVSPCTTKGVGPLPPSPSHRCCI